MYYALIVYSTPDSSHVEKTTFLLSYLVRYESRFETVERFLKFVDHSDKTGCEIVQLFTETFVGHAIPLADCRAQGFDNAASKSGKYNAASKSGKYNAAQAIIKEQYPTARFSSCGCHSFLFYY